MKLSFKKSAFVFLALAVLGFTGTMVSRSLYLQVIEEQKQYEANVLRPLEEKHNRETAAISAPAADGSVTVGLEPTPPSKEYLAAMEHYDQYSDTVISLLFYAFYTKQAGIASLLLCAACFGIHFMKARALNSGPTSGAE